MSHPRPAEMEMSPPRKSFWRNLSFVWLVPIAALAVTLFIAWQSWAARGTLIEIRFTNAAGVTADETVVRYRDVSVGLVENVRFSPDMESVIVAARVDQNVADNLPVDAQFWVVRPEVSARGISGLSTVLSGVYIEASFTPEPGVAASSFEGTNKAPLVLPGKEGTRLTIRASDGSRLSAGSPIFYRGIEVGSIEAPRLLDSGDGVVVEGFVEAPHDRRINSATRFWDVSGFSVSLGAGGLDLSVDSLASLVTGGISFDTVFSGGTTIDDDQVFDLFESEKSARESVFSDVIDNAVKLTVEFDESVSGLSAGSPVQYRGLRVGVVSAIGAFIQDTPGGQTVKLRVTISIDPQSMGLQKDVRQAETLAFLAGAVRDGLRAQLAAKSIFSNTLVVDLVDAPDAPEATLGIFNGEFPVLPSIQSDLPDVTATAEGLLQRVNDLPVEEVMEQAISLMASIEAVAAAEGTRTAPDAILALIEDARGLIGSEATQAIPQELRDTVGELRSTIAGLTKVTEDLQTADAVGQLVAALNAAEVAAEDFSGLSAELSEAGSDVPALIDDLRALTAKANSLEVEQLMTSAASFLDGADKLVDSDDMRALPAALTGALQEAQAALSQLREGGIVENANATLASASDAAKAVATAVESLPALSDRLAGLVRQAEGTLAGYSNESSFNRETVAALREVRQAAAAVSKLARALERNPNSLLFGR